MTGVDYPGFEVPDGTVIWRYMQLPRFHDVLKGRLYFAAAHQFDDQFEGAITDAAAAWRRQEAARLFPGDSSAQQRQLEQLSWAFGRLRRMTKINCWHARSAENVAMWERYLRGQPGAAVVSTAGALKQALSPFRLQPHYGEEGIFVAAVRYIDHTTEAMADASMLAVFLHKRAEYSDEAEIRAVLSLRTAVEFGVPITDDGVTVTVDPSVLIQRVRAWPGATANAVAELEAATRAAGVAAPVEPSTLDRPAIY
jgi:hypothetical protein